MYCHSCGKQIPDGAAFCTYCGTKQATQASGGNGAQSSEYHYSYVRPEPQQRPAYMEPPAAYQPPQTEARAYPGVYDDTAAAASGPDNSINALFVILAFVIPIFGVIYWPVKAKTRPRCAKVCGIVSIVSWILGFIAVRAGLA